ncbi:hypothetical protein ScPMuIL_009906 [Solemya velum]
MDGAATDDMTVIEISESSCVISGPGTSFTSNVSMGAENRNALVKQTTDSPKRKNKMVNVTGTCVSDSSSESTPKKIKGHKTPITNSVKDKPGEGSRLENRSPPVKSDQNTFSFPETHNQDSGLRSSLLEEVLAEKKMALLRSPDVMNFLQARQAQIRKEKEIKSSISSSQSEDDMDS